MWQALAFRETGDSGKAAPVKPGTYPSALRGCTASWALARYRWRL
jgi:hypothetical protein